MLFDGKRSWFLLPGVALLYYVRFWLEYQAWGNPTAVAAARATFDYGLIWLEYLPFLLLLTVEVICLQRGGQSFLNVREPPGIDRKEVSKRIPSRPRTEKVA
jgi:hypothetical protein